MLLPACLCPSPPHAAAQLGYCLPSPGLLRAVAVAADSSNCTPCICFWVVKQEKWQQHEGLRKRAPVKPRGCSKGTLYKQQCLPSAHQTCSSHCPVLSILAFLMCRVKITQACHASSALIPLSFPTFVSLGFSFLRSPSQPWKTS